MKRLLPYLSLFTSLLFFGQSGLHAREKTKGAFLNINRMIREQVDAGTATGIAAGVLDENGSSIYTYGTVSGSNEQKVDLQSVFNVKQLGGENAKVSLAEMLQFLADALKLSNSRTSSNKTNINSKKDHSLKPEEKAMALNWKKGSVRGAKYLWQADSNTGGSWFVGLIRKKKTGVVLLTNGSDPVDELGKLIFQQKLQLKQPFYKPIYNSHKKFGMEVGMFPVTKDINYSIRLHYNLHWGPGDLLEFRPFIGGSAYGLKDSLPDRNEQEICRFQIIEAGAFLDLGNIFAVLFPGTFLRYLASGLGVKMNYIGSVKTEEHGKVTSDFPSVCFQLGGFYGFQLGRIVINYENGWELLYTDKNKKYSQFGSDIYDQQQKITFGYFF